MPSLHIQCFCLGDWMTNCFVVHAPGPEGASGKAAPQPCGIVDAGFQPAPLIEYIRARDLEPSHVVLTHAHVDHIAGLSDVRAAWPEVPILIHESERSFLLDPALNLSSALGEPVIAPAATGVLVPGQELAMGGFRFEVRHTPGHSPGGVTLYARAQDVAIVGDALFAGSVGRADFPTSDQALLFKSIREQLLSLPDQTRVLSGHGPETTIGRERQTNPFLSHVGR